MIFAGSKFNIQNPKPQMLFHATYIHFQVSSTRCAKEYVVFLCHLVINASAVICINMKISLGPGWRSDI